MRVKKKVSINPSNFELIFRTPSKVDHFSLRGEFNPTPSWLHIQLNYFFAPPPFDINRPSNIAMSTKSRCDKNLSIKRASSTAPTAPKEKRSSKFAHAIVPSSLSYVVSGRHNGDIIRGSISAACGSKLINLFVN